MHAASWALCVATAVNAAKQDAQVREVADHLLLDLPRQAGTAQHGACVALCARVSPVVRVCTSRVRLQGVDVLVSLVDASQPGLFGMILEQVWVPNTQKVSGRLERKIVCLGMLKVSPRHGTAVLAVGGASPVLGDVAGASPVPVQMWQGRAQSRCRRGYEGPPRNSCPTARAPTGSARPAARCAGRSLVRSFACGQMLSESAVMLSDGYFPKWGPVLQVSPPPPPPPPRTPHAHAACCSAAGTGIHAVRC